MLRAKVVANDKLQYVSGIAVKLSPTRYYGDYWDRTASDLLCGVADSFQDVGVVMTAQPWDADIKIVSAADHDRWVPLESNARAHKSVWSLSDNAGWVFVPHCREAVEDVMSWTIPHLKDGKASDGSLSIVFPGRQDFRKHLDSVSWPTDGEKLKSFINETCLKTTLFTMTWSWTVWTLYPGSIEVDQLLKLADPVIARINAYSSE